MLSLLYDPTLTSVYDYWKNHSFDYMDLCQQSAGSAFELLSRLILKAFLPRSKRLSIKNLPAMQEIQVQSLDQEDPLEKGMATHSNSCLENSMDRGAWRATVHRVTKSWTQLSD